MSLVNNTIINNTAAVGGGGIWTYEMTPNIMNTIIIMATIEIGGIIVLTASMSFLGLGTQPPSCDWGLMLAEGRQYITYASWLVTFPGLAIVITVLGFNLTGDWLREILDPKQKLR